MPYPSHGVLGTASLGTMTAGDSMPAAVAMMERTTEASGNNSKRCNDEHNFSVPWRSPWTVSTLRDTRYGTRRQKP